MMLKTITAALPMYIKLGEAMKKKVTGNSRREGVAKGLKKCTELHSFGISGEVGTGTNQKSFCGEGGRTVSGNTQ